MITKVLSKILGVNSIILIQHDSKIEKISYNSPPDNFYPQLHFIALQQNLMFQIHVLITHTHGYEDQFNIYLQSSYQNTSLSIINAPYQKMPSNESKMLCYYIELTNTYNMILNNIYSITKQIPCDYSLNSLDTKISQLKSKENMLKIPEKNLQENRPIIFEKKIHEFFQLCESCNEPNPDYCNKIGCYFHEKCLEFLFQK